MAAVALRPVFPAVAIFAWVLLGWAAFLLLLVVVLWVVRGEQRHESAEERRSSGDRRSGPPDRRRGLPDSRPAREERRAGDGDRRSGRERRGRGPLTGWAGASPATGR